MISVKIGRGFLPALTLAGVLIAAAGCGAAPSKDESDVVPESEAAVAGKGEPLTAGGEDETDPDREPFDTAGPPEKPATLEAGSGPKRILP